MTDVQEPVLERSAPRSSRIGVVPVLTTVALVALAGTALLFPYRGDHAVYALIVRDGLNGRLLYSEIWDIKQPGLLLWYGLVTKVLGFTQFATRLLDVLAVVALGLLVRALLARRLAHPRVLAWTPAAVVAVVLLSAGPLELGQIEMLCAVPAVAAFVLVARSPRTPPTVLRLVAAGLCLGVIGVFKLVLAVVPALAVVGYLLLTAGPGRRLRSLVTVTAAAVVPVVAMVLWLIVAGVWADAWRTWTVDPIELAATPGAKSVTSLVRGAGRYLLLMAPVALLAGWQAAGAWRRRDPLDLAMLTWLGMNLVVIVVQFWWTYQWYFLSAPLIVLALRRIDALAAGAAPSRARVCVGGAVLAVLAVPMLGHGLVPVAQAVADGGGLTHATRAAIDQRIAQHGTIRAELAAAAVRPDDRLYVLGDPLYNYLADLPLPLRTNGWGYEFFTPRHWAGVAAEVEAVRPTLVLVDPVAEPMVDERAPGLRAVLDRRYVESRRSDQGVWYRLKSIQP
jgi:hypothetical protein